MSLLGSLLAMQRLIENSLDCGLEFVSDELSHKVLSHDLFWAVTYKLVCILVPHIHSCRDKEEEGATEVMFQTFTMPW